mmetsp:Transcript_16244/g.49463  ORF Transcript_16244/g.49463 Transcript_16244/m.49463 type:complete len:205 (+) Transcript_16244:644-1258(+)|eukprot:scaffold302056_cov28-Tisochrysis_lutea.AAC.2
MGECAHAVESTAVVGTRATIPVRGDARSVCASCDGDGAPTDLSTAVMNEEPTDRRSAINDSHCSRPPPRARSVRQTACACFRLRAVDGRIPCLVALLKSSYGGSHLVLSVVSGINAISSRHVSRALRSPECCAVSFWTAFSGCDADEKASAGDSGCTASEGVGFVITLGDVGINTRCGNTAHGEAQAVCFAKTSKADDGAPPSW